MASLKSALVSVVYAVNSLLPFTRPGTPLIQDIIHTLALCALLYFISGLLEDYTERRLALDTAYRDVQASGGHSDSRKNESRWMMVLRSVQYLLPWLRIIPGRHSQALHSSEGTLRGETVPGPAAEDGSQAQDDRHTGPANDLTDDGNTLAYNAPQLPPHANGFAQPPAPDLPAPENNEPDPAPPPPNQPQPAESPTRSVGAKKGKSLARKDQRRAYHEFMRSQGNAQREKEEAEAKAREAELAEERRRRLEFEQSVKEKERVEREARKEALRQEQEDERRFRERLIKVVRSRVEEVGCCDLNEVASQEGFHVDEVRTLVRAAGLVRDDKGEAGRVVCRTMVTGSGWLVRVEEGLMKEVWREVAEREDVGDEDGKVGWEDIGRVLEGCFSRRMKSAAV